MEPKKADGGVIRKEYSVYCATCPELDTFHVATLHEAERMARMYKWSETDQFGWMCPACCQRRKDGEELKQWSTDQSAVLTCELPGG
jgi:hypothetical protein